MSAQDTALSTATIHTSKLLDNISTFKQSLQKDAKFMAVIKANAYSHGAVPVAKTIERNKAADYFGVAQLREALELRSESIDTPILIFNAARPAEIKQAIEQKISLTVFSTEMAAKITETAEALEKTVKVHLKIDTGMGRLGVRTFEEAFEIYQALNSPFVSIEGIYTHFADSPEDTGTNFTQKQFSHFKIVLDQFEEKGITFSLRHCCNTAGTINFPEFHLDMVRVGLGLYGLNPLSTQRDKIDLSPVASVSTTVTYAKDFPADESIGYGRTYYSKKPMRVATVAIGYADGVAKSLSNKGYFTFQGRKLPILGQVCMDQIMLDCSEAPELTAGDEVTYFGDPADGETPLYTLAVIADDSQYELICRLGTRVNRVYLS